VIRIALLAVAFLSITFSLALLVTGGFITNLAGMRVSARSPLPAALLAAAAGGAWAALAARAGTLRGDLGNVGCWMDRRAPTLILIIAATAGAAAILFNSFSAGGSDASGYLSYASLLSEGRITRQEPMAMTADWPDAATTLAPLGWRTGRDPGEQVPTYAVGLPLLLAVPHAVGGAIAASLVVPLTLFAAAAAAGALARGLGGGVAGIVAAAWVASSPVALIESMQVMSDVPVTAAWLGCWAMLTVRSAAGVGGRDPDVSDSASDATPRFLDLDARGSAIAGVLAAVAVLIRPNLAPAALVPALFVLRRAGAVRAVIFSAPVAIAGLVVGYLQWRYFGSPFRSGYGTAEEIYAVANLAPNVRLYREWLIDSHGPWLLLAPVALFWPTTARAPLRWLLLFAALVIASYLLYAVFETWTYLRFLLPALAIAAVAVACMLAALLAYLPGAARVLVVALVLLAVAASNVAAARRLGVFRFATQQSRALLAGRYLQSALPMNAVVVAGEQSGSVRYYAGRPIVRWDLLDPPALEGVLERLTRRGYDVWVVLDTWEEEPFRARFRGASHGGLDWPPLMDAGTEMRTRAWRFRDREPFIKGDRMVTDRMRGG
jgi:hypothetical protein